MNNGLRIEDGWCQYIPLLHRILADTSQQKAFPSLSESGELSQACAYWETLYYLCTALLCWQRLDMGLGWWYSVDKDDQKEPLLKLVQQVWDDDDQLDFFAAWAWTQVYYTSPVDISPSSIFKQAAYGDENWWRSFKRKGRRFNHDPFYGGTNPLHLGHSQAFGYNGPRSGDPKMYLDSSTRKAVVIVGQFSSWRHDLERLGATLPPLGEHSWHVEVFDRQVGFLGLFRQSRETGLWFIGKHSLHMRGNLAK